MYLKLLDVKLIEVLYDRLSGTGTCTNNFSYYINMKKNYTLQKYRMKCINSFINSSLSAVPVYEMRF